MSIFKKLFLPEKKEKVFNLKRYIQDLEKGLFKDHFNLGICETGGGEWLLKDFIREPNAAFIGAMGSGKSAAANFSVVTWMLANSHQTIMFIIDPVKGATDYSNLFNLKQVFLALNSETAIHRTIDLVYDEAMARKDFFSKHQAENIEQYEEITGEKMTRVILLMEEFHAIPYAILDFQREFKNPHTSANKFYTLMRIGRSLGIWFIACSQKGTSSDIPSEIVPNFTQKQIFRVSTAESTYFLGDTSASLIKSDLKGRCVTDFGSVQFPMINHLTQRKLIEKYCQPLESISAYLTPEIINDYLGGKSPEELYKLKKLPELVMGIENLESDLIAEIMHKKIGHKVNRIDSKVDPFGMSMVIDWPNRGKVAVMVRIGKLTGKHIIRLANGMKVNKCNHGVLYTSDENLSTALYKAAVNNNIEIVDHEDMIRMARQIEAHGKNLELDPTKLADDSKESGSFQKLNKIKDEVDAEELPDVVEKIEIAPDVETKFIKPIEKETEDSTVVDKKLEELFAEDSSKQALQEIGEHIISQNPLMDKVKPLQRIATRGKFFLTTEERPELLIQTQRNQDNEVYRILFYVIVDKKVRHKYFLDKKVKGKFSDEDKAKLKINSTEEWNNQYDDTNSRPIFDDSQFNLEVINFLNNFKQLDVNLVKAICWKSDLEFVKSLVEKSDYMDKLVIEVEDFAFQSTTIPIGREALEKQNGMNIKRVDMFTEIEILFQVWKQLSS